MHLLRRQHLTVGFLEKHRMVLSAANSAISASASLPSDSWPFDTCAFALANMTSRHHSPRVLPPACAVSSSLAYSSSLTFVPMDFVRRDGLTIKFFVGGLKLRVRKINKLTRG